MNGQPNTRSAAAAVLGFAALLLLPQRAVAQAWRDAVLTETSTAAPRRSVRSRSSRLGRSPVWARAEAPGSSRAQSSRARRRRAARPAVSVLAGMLGSVHGGIGGAQQRTAAKMGTSIFSD